MLFSSFISVSIINEKHDQLCTLLDFNGRMRLVEVYLGGQHWEDDNLARGVFN